MTMDISQISVGAAIRRIRKARGMTLADVAAALGTDTGNLSRVENGKQGYSDDLITKLAGVFNCDRADFFSSHLADIELAASPARSSGGAHFVPPKPSPATPRHNSAPWGRPLPPDSPSVLLEAALPEEMRIYAKRALIIRGKEYLFPFVGGRTIATVNFQPTRAITINFVRMAIYRSMLAKFRNQDELPPERYHYLVAVVNTPGPQEVQPFPLIKLEAQLFGVQLEYFPSFSALADRIVALESTTTPAEDMYADMGNDDLI